MVNFREVHTSYLLESLLSNKTPVHIRNIFDVSVEYIINYTDVLEYAILFIFQMPHISSTEYFIFISFIGVFKPRFKLVSTVDETGFKWHLNS